MKPSIKSVFKTKRLAMQEMLAVFGTATAAIMALSFALPTVTAKPDRSIRIQRKQGDDPLKSQKSQVALVMALEGGPEVVTDEPLVLHYVITNSSPVESEAIAADFDEYYAKMVALTMIGEDGTALPPLPQPTRQLPISPIGTGGGILYGGQSYDGFIVLTQRFALTHKGKYTLTVTVNVPYARYNPYGERQIIDFGNLRATGLALRGKYTFPITVREGTSDDLVDAANKLRKRFVAWTDAKQKERFAAALFSMDPSKVLSVWKRAAYESSAADRPIVAKALAQTFKNEAADVLVKMELNHPVKNNDGNPVSVLRTISDMNYAGSPDLQKHLKDLFAAYRMKVPSYPRAFD